MMRSSSVLAKKQHNITRNNTATYSQISLNVPSGGGEIVFGGNEGEKLLSEGQVAQMESQQNRYIYQSPYSQERKDIKNT